MGGKRAGHGICANGFCSQPGFGPSYWLVAGGQVWLAFTILDDRRCGSFGRYRHHHLHETSQGTFKNKVGSASSISPFDKNNFAVTISTRFYGHDFVGDRWFYAHAVWKHI